MSAVLSREVFTTSRAAEFCTCDGLKKQTGHSAEDWPLYVVKELIDNALDAAEEHNLAPQVEIAIAANSITVIDNGPGIAPEVIKRLCDLGSRTSARSKYVSPTRGAQGQALSTILVMPHALDPDGGGKAMIQSRGYFHSISVDVNTLTGEPRLALVSHEVEGLVNSGTTVVIHWPDSASSTLEDANYGFLPLVLAYSICNPHVSIILSRRGRDPFSIKATDLDWKKWRACDPTSPHWYDRESFERLVAALIHKDQEMGRSRPLRDFLSEFDGLSSTSRRSKVVEELGFNRLGDLYRDGELDKAVMARLLQAMQAQTKPVKPGRLGTIGETSLRDRLGDKAFRYAREMGTDAAGFPFVIEGAFSYIPEADDRTLIMGANFASSHKLSFRLGTGYYAPTVEGLLVERFAGLEEPIGIFLHVTHPRLTTTDLGKTQIVLPELVIAGLRKVVERITEVWYQQKKKEMRDARAERRRQDELERARNRTMFVKDSVFRHLPAAYAKVSGGIAARSRQLFYELRPLVLADTGRKELEQDYIVYTLIPEFIANNPDLCAKWTVLYDDRGHLIEPHTEKSIGIGTKNVREYCGGWGRPIISEFELSPPSVTTCGPAGRYGAILYCEKEGFTELFHATKLPEKYDIAIASNKGTSVTACREMFELAGRLGIPIFPLHDFDYNGFEIAATLRRDTKRYQFEHPPEVIDIGLRLGDVGRLGLDKKSEPGTFGKKSPAAALRNLERNGATAAEIDFLVEQKRRVELNALTTPDLLELIETALKAHGVKKVVPDARTLAALYRSEIEYRRAAQAVEEAIRKAREELGEIDIPRDLANQAEDYLAEHPTAAWEDAIRHVAAGA